MKKFGALLLLAFLLIAGYLLWWQRGIAPVNKRSDAQLMFVVERGEGLRAIANDLKGEGLIKDPVIFFLLVKQLGLDKKIQAGAFQLSPSMNATEIAKALTKGSLDIWVTIPEGKRAEEIADILEEKIPGFDQSWREQLRAKEGYLFPDTYLIPRDATIETVLALLTNTFNQKYALIENPTNLSQSEIVTIGSLIEREAKHDQDRAIVSSVIHNRLDLGMKLDLDATIQYALGNSRNSSTWWPQITRDDYSGVHSPYNTYLNAGLPPTPISNPGVESMQAAANPATTNYLYYITDANGVNRYARTIEEQNANIEKYGL